MVWDVGTVGEKVLEGDILGKLEHYCEKKCCLDEHHQDQLLIYMALAQGKSEIYIGEELSLHTQSLLYVIKSFIPQFMYSHQDGILSIEGIAHKCKPL